MASATAECEARQGGPAEQQRRAAERRGPAKPARLASGQGEEAAAVQHDTRGQTPSRDRPRPPPPSPPPGPEPRPGGALPAAGAATPWGAPTGPSPRGPPPPRHPGGPVWTTARPRAAPPRRARATPSP